MKHFITCLRREIMASFRGVQGFGLAGMFLVFGISNPLLAQLTPLVMEALSDAYAQMGMEVPRITANALTSWGQFFNNISLILIIFHIVLARIFTREYGSGTLIIPITKGLSRRALLLSKSAWLLILWTVGYALSVGITYLITGILWNNGTVLNLWRILPAWYLFGVWTISLLVLFSTVFRNSAMVMLGTGGVVFAFYLLGLLPVAGRYMPTALMDVSALASNDGAALVPFQTYLITLGLTALPVAVSVPLFDRKTI